MNNFRVRSALIAGVQAIPVVIESVQSRRLPFLQILGGGGKEAAELKERVSAAIFSSQLRLPSRRITIQIQPGVHGLPLEHLDLAVALAILGGSGQVPAERVENLLVCGALGLDGRLRPLLNRSAIRRLVEEERFASALLPWRGSEVLSGNQLGSGGGFRNLGEVVSYLRKGGEGVCAPSVLEADPPPPAGIWEKISGQSAAKRLLEVSAAGHHHAFLASPPNARVDLLAHALSLLLPSLTRLEMEEVQSIYSLAGIDPAPCRPFYVFGSRRKLANLLPHSPFRALDEVFLAHQGVLYLENAALLDDSLHSALSGPMKSGRWELSMASCMIRLPANPLVIAQSARCGCGGAGYGGCACRPTEAKRFRARWRHLRSLPFDLFSSLDSPRMLREDEESMEIRMHRVYEARQRMLARQGKPNGRLSETEAFQAKPLSKGAASSVRSWQLREWGRDFGPLFRVALTISDLRGGELVEEKDVLEARHYFEAGEEGDGSFPGRTPASSSVPETKSIAMP